MKSYVTMEAAVCPICGKDEDTGAILMDTRMRERFDRRTVTGWGLCADHRALYADGFVALVEVKPMPGRDRDRVNADEVDRTGRIMHLAFHVAAELIPGLAKDGKMPPLAFVPPEAIERIIEICKAQGVEPMAPEDRPERGAREVPNA